ncbi:MAG: serine/threonine protein kinase, partial [Chloroflexota bacterium]|nr:serine/threonine protein kinase [Chloroflexota bacterium]
PAGPYLVQEFLAGQTLDQLIPLPSARAAGIVRGIAAGLGAIHTRGYVHCDVKPQNILLRDNGTPVLLDFGIARAEGANTTTLIATPHYLAPERAQGAAPTPAADLYALGIVLFQALTGHPPFDGPSVHTIIQQHIETPIPPLRIDDPAAPVLDRIIARLTAKRPEDRYPSTDAVEQDLATVERGTLHAQPTVVVPTARPGGVAPPPVALPQASRTIKPPSAAPAWRRQRWMAVLTLPILLLLLGYGIARARRTSDQLSPALATTPIAVTPASAIVATPDPAVPLAPSPTPEPSLVEPEPPPPPSVPDSVAPADGNQQNDQQQGDPGKDRDRDKEDEKKDDQKKEDEKKDGEKKGNND